MSIFEQFESNVRSYCRKFTDVFHYAKGSVMVAEDGKEFTDFFSGAGALNYGHNHPYLKQKLLEYVASDGIVHSLDMHTKAKREFIEYFQHEILVPKRLDYKMQFCGPTGTNAVEAALKLARKVKQRTGIFSFMGGFHGMSQGSLAATGNLFNRSGAGIPLTNVTFMPYPYGFMETFDTIDYIENVLTDVNSGIEKPAAVLFETVQAEGGIVIAPTEWIRRLSELCRRHDILLICDDIQVGCGRTGPFFSFERAGITPDIVVLSKSISGYGLPMSMLLLKPELDIWQPGEHSGTFRGNQLAFVAGKGALELRKNTGIEEQTQQRATLIESFLNREIAPLHNKIQIRGIGMIWGIDISGLGDRGAGDEIVSVCYQNGLIIEVAGRHDTVVKILPALTIELDLLLKGLQILKEAIAHYLVTNGEAKIAVHA